MQSLDYVVPGPMTESDALISDEEYSVIESVMCAIRGSIAAFGMVANILNIRIFCYMGLNDGLSISFLFLAVSDMIYLITVISRAVSFIFVTIETTSNYTIWFPVEPYGVYIFTGHVGRVPYILSNLNTTFLAVARCLCVARPLRFKHMFGRKITLIILTSFVVFSVGSYLPVMLFMGMNWQYSTNINATRPSLWVAPNTEVTDIVWAIRDAFVPFASQLVIIVCVVIMVKCLRAAYNFHLQHAKSVVRTASINMAGTKANGVTSGHSKWGDDLSRKDLQVIHQVTLISIEYIICNTPTILINFTRVYVPQFTIDKLYNNLYYTATGIKHFFQTINASLTFVIYLKYNKKFKLSLRSLCKTRTNKKTHRKMLIHTISEM